MDYLDIIKEFMRNILIFSVLSAFCIHLLPEKRYQKYVQFAVGLVYICMVLDAVSRLFGKTIPVITF